MSLSKLLKELKVPSSLSTARRRIVHNGAPSPYHLIERIFAEHSTRMIMQSDAVIQRGATESSVTGGKLATHQYHGILPLYGA